MNDLNIAAILYGISIWALPILIAITFHEAAHGFVAARRGDDTALRLGRVTFNPLKHIDPVGTVILPAILILAQSPILFGYAKPVPVRFDRLNNPRRDMVWVAAAGPGMNIALAFVCAIILGFVDLLPENIGPWLEANLNNAILINLVLAVFNMLPLPPLDGGRVAVGLLPNALALPLARLERFGLVILLGLLFFLPPVGRAIGIDISLFEWFIWPLVEFLYTLIAVLVW